MNKIGLILLLLLISGSTSIACTGFYINRDGKIYAGNNEDYNNPNTKMWIIPGDHENYGRIYFGLDDYYPQGGINEKGLFFDGFATQPLPVNRSEKKLNYTTAFFFNTIQNEILSTCSNVDEVVSFLNKYNLDFLERAILFFGDAHGNSIIVEGDSILRKDKDFQVTTNFYQSQTKEVACRRFKTATDMLSSNKKISVDYCRDILDFTHVEDQNSTLYSQVYDIKNMKIHIYNFHNYDECVIIDIKEELEKGLTYYDLPALFTKTSKYQEFKERYMTEINEEIAQRKIMNSQINSDFEGRYLLKSVVGPAKSFEIDSNYYMTIDIKDEKLIYTQRYGQHYKCDLLQESGNKFFYKGSLENQVSFPKNNGEELIFEFIFGNNITVTSTWIKIES